MCIKVDSVCCPGKHTPVSSSPSTFKPRRINKHFQTSKSVPDEAPVLQLSVLLEFPIQENETVEI